MEGIIVRVWVTRDEPRDGRLSTALRKVGLTPVWEPVLERHIVDDAGEEIARLGPEDWLVLTSAFAVEAIAAKRTCPARIAVVGAATDKAVRARGLQVDLVASDKTGRSLFDDLRTKVSKGMICYPRSSLADAPVPWPGVELICPVVYETRARDFDRSVISRVDVISVASPSAVAAVGLADRPFASIGPSTTAAVRKLGREPWIEAPDRSFESLAQSIANSVHSP